MLSKLKRTKLQKTDKGFTIIEVMIVLAIAGLILLIVFLAVPALQRNARNTSIKSDAGNVSGGISAFESNNNGIVPSTINAASGVVTLSASGATTDTIKVGGSTKVTTAASNTPPVTNGSLITPPADSIVVYPGYECSGTVSTRATAVVYATETSSSTQGQCIDS